METSDQNTDSLPQPPPKKKAPKLAPGAFE